MIMHLGSLIRIKTKIIQEISTQAINYYKIITLLSPILPNLFDESCKILNIKKLNIKNYKDPTLDHEINKFSPLKNRIDEEDVKEFVNYIGEYYGRNRPHLF